MTRAAWLLLLVGCDLGTGPDVEYVNRRPMDPVPAWYREAYEETEECLGARGDFDAVRWFIADEIRHETRGPSLGALDPPNDITIDDRSIHHTPTVRHEAAHHITGLGDAIHVGASGAVCDGVH